MYLLQVERDLELSMYLCSVMPGVSKRIVKNLLALHKRKKIKLSCEIKRSICRCFVLQVASVTCSSRLVREKEGYFIRRECRSCGEVVKMRVLSRQRFFNGGEEEAEQEGKKRAEVFKT